MVVDRVRPLRAPDLGVPSRREFMLLQPASLTSTSMTYVPDLCKRAFVLFVLSVFFLPAVAFFFFSLHFFLLNALPT